MYENLYRERDLRIDNGKTKHKEIVKNLSAAALSFINDISESSLHFLGCEKITNSKTDALEQLIFNSIQRRRVRLITLLN